MRARETCFFSDRRATEHPRSLCDVAKHTLRPYLTPRSSTAFHAAFTALSTRLCETLRETRQTEGLGNTPLLVKATALRRSQEGRKALNNNSSSVFPTPQREGATAVLCTFGTDAAHNPTDYFLLVGGATSGTE